MKYFALAVLLAVGLTFVGCGSSSSSNSANINGTWKATLMQSNNNAPYFQFGTSLAVNGDGTLTVSNLTITSASPCFATAASESGSFKLSGNFNGNVQGTFNFTLQSASPAGSTLTLTGTANGKTISGNWSLSGAFGCTGTGTGTFTMTRM